MIPWGGTGPYRGLGGVMRGVKGGTVLWGGNGPMGVTLTPVGGVKVGHGPTVGAAWSYVGGL